MNDREKLIAWIRDVSKFHEEVKEKWILGGKQGERPSLIASIADHLLANGVVVREKGEWEIRVDDFDNEYMLCPVCREEFYDGDNDTVDRTPNFCPNCGADMRGVKSE
jgi:hypothetical protein